MTSPTGSYLTNTTCKVHWCQVPRHNFQCNGTGCCFLWMQFIGKKKLFQRLSSSVQIWLLLLTNLWRLL